MIAMPQILVKIRADMCRHVGCTIDHDFTDPCAVCSVSGWGRYSVDCKTIDPALPGMLTMVKNFVGSATRHIAGGMVERSKEEADSLRAQFCNPPGAPCVFYRSVDDRCAKCGCWLSEATRWKSKPCPIGRW